MAYRVSFSDARDRATVATVGDLLRVPRRTLLELHGFGAVSLNEVRRELLEHGLRFEWDVPEAATVPISEPLARRLYAALERKYPGKVRRAIEVCPVAVMKTIDNEADALETLRRLGEA